jgi:SAM-dependent methyltransferase
VRLKSNLSGRYSSPAYLATYLHAEWGDVLYPPGHALLRTPFDLRIPSVGGGFGPGLFYQEVARLAKEWIVSTETPYQRICDIGGGTGRFCFEMARAFPDASELLLVEPSEMFCLWSRRILLGTTDGVELFPVPDSLEEPCYMPLLSDRLPEPQASLEILNATAAEVSRSGRCFDIVTCLNVIDRVDDPSELVDVIYSLLRPGGMVVLASPLHFEEEFTARSGWIRDMKQLLDPGKWVIEDRECDVGYSLAHYRRRINCYLSQVIGAMKM